MRSQKADRKSKCGGNNYLAVINIFYLLVLAVVVAPLLVNGRYNYPSADDWSFGANGYHALKSGGGLAAAAGAACRTVKEFYVSWEGRFGAVFLEAFQPGIFGEKCYVVVPYLMIGMLVFSQIFLYGSLLRTEDRTNRWLIVPAVVPFVILDILYTPSVVESFYWYNGSVMYTFADGLGLVLIALVWRKVNGQPQSQKLCFKSICVGIVMFVASVLTGGGNFATSLSVFLTLVILDIVYTGKERKIPVSIYGYTLVVFVCMIIAILAPGNTVRMQSSFAGHEHSIFGAITGSLWRTFTNIISWSNWKTFLVFFLTVPFIRRAVGNVKYSFRFPALFTFFSFCIYASKMTATMYADGTSGGDRMAAVLYYSYHLWVLLNLTYWLGWISRVFATKQKEEDFLGKWGILLYCAVTGMVLAGLIYKTDLKEVSSYRAYRDYRQGWSAGYASEWEQRFEILHDDQVRDVVFAPLRVCPETFLYTDLQPESGYVWVNEACANYYGKNSVMIREIQTETEE